MKPALALALAALALFSPAAGGAQSLDDRPWMLDDAVLVIDPYQDNSIDWAKVRTDPKVKAMIHRAFDGVTADTRYAERVREARQAGLLVGLYLLGRPGDPIAQANKLVEAAAQAGVTFLALDIENLDPGRSMKLADAARFVERVHDRTGRYPALYVNFSTYQFISRHYGADSVFAKTPLWLARFGPVHGMQGQTVWSRYSIWQFQSEIDCVPCPAAYGGSAKACRKRGDGTVVNESCYHSVPGTRPDMDVNVFRGSMAELEALFRAE